jgi:hypothetical protein
MARWQVFLPSYAGIIGYAPPPVSVPGVNSRPYRMTTPKRRLPPHTHRAASLATVLASSSVMRQRYGHLGDAQRAGLPPFLRRGIDCDH